LKYVLLSVAGIHMEPICGKPQNCLRTRDGQLQENEIKYSQTTGNGNSIPFGIVKH